MGYTSVSDLEYFWQSACPLITVGKNKLKKKKTLFAPHLLQKGIYCNP